MNLLSAALGGTLSAVAFVLCFAFIGLLRCAKAGFPEKNSLQEEPRESKPEPQKPPEPVYYIVERKTKRPKKEYSQPKEIKFK